MKKLKFQPQSSHLNLFADDVDKIVKKFAEKGYVITRQDACLAWEEYSDCYAAGWLCIGSELSDCSFNVLLNFFHEEIT